MKLLSGELIPSGMILGMSVALSGMCRCPWTGVNVLPTVRGDCVWPERDGVPSSGDSRMHLVQPSLWTADHPEILRVFAVMNTPSVRLAVFQSFSPFLHTSHYPSKWGLWQMLEVTKALEQWKNISCVLKGKFSHHLLTLISNRNDLYTFQTDSVLKLVIGIVHPIIKIGWKCIHAQVISSKM